jgi:hypothetical protein
MSLAVSHLGFIILLICSFLFNILGTLHESFALQTNTLSKLVTTCQMRDILILISSENYHIAGFQPSYCK